MCVLNWQIFGQCWLWRIPLWSHVIFIAVVPFARITNLFQLKFILYNRVDKWVLSDFNYGIVRSTLLLLLLQQPWKERTTFVCSDQNNAHKYFNCSHFFTETHKKYQHKIVRFAYIWQELIGRQVFDVVFKTAIKSACEWDCRCEIDSIDAASISRLSGSWLDALICVHIDSAGYVHLLA